MTVYSETDGISFASSPGGSSDRESRGISVKEYPAGDLLFYLKPGCQLSGDRRRGFLY